MLTAALYFSLSLPALQLANSTATGFARNVTKYTGHEWRANPHRPTNIRPEDIPDRKPPESDLRYTSACTYLSQYLPSFCQCTDTSTLGATLECSVNVLDIDTVGVRADFEPCADPLHMDLEITESTFGIDYPIADLTAGTDEEVPIPGLSFSIPVVGSAGANMAIKIDGNVADLTVAVGVDACMSVLGVNTCGKDLTSMLPIYILQGDFHFSALCGGGTYDTYSAPTYDAPTYDAPTYDATYSTYSTYSGGEPVKK